MDRKSKIKNLDADYRPYEKFAKYGPEALTGAELLAIILKSGPKGMSSVELAHEVLHSVSEENEDILKIFDLEFEDLLKINGIGQVKALQIKAVAELSRRLSVCRAGKKLKLNEPDTIAEYYYEQLRHRKCETVLLLLLTSSCELIKEIVLSEGTVNASLFSPREILIHALRYEAVSLILVHNHPSGSPDPSNADITGTLRVAEACKIAGIPLLDHIIIGDRVYCSLKKEGILNG